MKTERGVNFFDSCLRSHSYKTPVSLFISALFFLFLSNSLFAQDIDNYINLAESGKECLKFTCKVSSEVEPLSPMEVILYLNNNVIDHRVLDKTKKVKFILKRDALYFVQISAPFYISRYIMINTTMPKKLKQEGGLYKHEMEIELFKEPKIYYTANINPDVLDKPVTLIRYFNSDDKFDLDGKYTNNVKRELRKFKKSINKLLMDQVPKE